MKNAMFQFFDGKEMVHDTGLLALSDAIAIFDEHKDEFAFALEHGDSPQMVIWHDCEHDEDYKSRLRDWDESNVKVIDGDIWVRD